MPSLFQFMTSEDVEKKGGSQFEIWGRRVGGPGVKGGGVRESERVSEKEGGEWEWEIIGMINENPKRTSNKNNHGPFQTPMQYE